MTAAAPARRSSPRVQVIAPASIGETAIAALRARGIEAQQADAPGEDIVAWALDGFPSATAAVELAQACARAAEAGRPVCLLAPPLRGTGRAAIERAAALAYLRAHGAALAHDVDAWLEAVVALVRFGLPRGPHAAVIAPEGSWLLAQAHALAAEAEAAGARTIVVGRGREATDVVLYDPAAGPATGQLLHVPVIARGELAGDETALYGLRAALGALEVLGRAAERIAIGLGAAPLAASAELEIDRDRVGRQLGKLVAGQRVGDHETKTLLRAYGVPITKQMVALTPSAAVNAAKTIAKVVGYPVELKPWGPNVPSERDGCPIERDVTSDALVRRAYAAVLTAAYGHAPTQADPGAVIVRETPPSGRDLIASFVQLPALGWTVVLDAPGGQLAAAPAPLRLADARALAAALVASRAGDPEPDREGLANLLRRASHLAVDLGDRLRSLELSRIVVGGRGAKTLVADASCELAP
jgi:hypothetical protein